MLVAYVKKKDVNLKDVLVAVQICATSNSVWAKYQTGL